MKLEIHVSNISKDCSMYRNLTRLLSICANDDYCDVATCHAEDDFGIEFRFDDSVFIKKIILNRTLLSCLAIFVCGSLSGCAWAEEPREREMGRIIDFCAHLDLVRRFEMYYHVKLSTSSFLPAFCDRCMYK